MGAKESVSKEFEDKAAYAALLLIERDSFQAAMKLYPHDVSRALWIAQNWGMPLENGSRKDPEVDRLLKEMRESSSIGGMDEDDIYLEEKIKQAIDGAEEWRDRIKAIELYAEIKGKKKREPAGSVTVVLPRAIEIPVHGSNEEWEAAAEKQQRELLSVSRSKH